MPNTAKPATAAQVRKHYRSQGYEVHIDQDGHIEFRKNNAAWLDGRLVSEYDIISGFGPVPVVILR